MNYYDKPYSYLNIMNEFNSIEQKALHEIRSKKRLIPASIVYKKNMMYWVGLKQFDTQEIAKQNIAQLVRDKDAVFYITAGLTKQPHPIDYTQDIIHLNLVLGTKDTITCRKLELHFSNDNVTILKREQNVVNIKKEKEIIKSIHDSEKLVDNENASPFKK